MRQLSSQLRSTLIQLFDTQNMAILLNSFLCVILVVQLGDCCGIKSNNRRDYNRQRQELVTASDQELNTTNATQSQADTNTKDSGDSEDSNDSQVTATLVRPYTVTSTMAPTPDHTGGSGSVVMRDFVKFTTSSSLPELLFPAYPDMSMSMSTYRGSVTPPRNLLQRIYPHYMPPIRMAVPRTIVHDDGLIHYGDNVEYRKPGSGESNSVDNSAMATGYIPILSPPAVNVNVGDACTR